MNFWSFGKSLPEELFNGFHEMQPIYHPIEMKYQYILHSVYSPSGCFPILETEAPQENEKNILTTFNTENSILVEANRQIKSTELKNENESFNSKGSKNIKANIFREFIKTLKKDATCILMVREALGIDYSIKSFIEEINRKLPKEGKYIRLKVIEDLSHHKEDENFSKIFRILFRNFLMKDYKLMILGKKKTRMEFLRASREMIQKIFTGAK